MRRSTIVVSLLTAVAIGLALFALLSADRPMPPQPPPLPFDESVTTEQIDGAANAAVGDIYYVEPGDVWQQAVCQEIPAPPVPPQPPEDPFAEFEGQEITEREDFVTRAPDGVGSYNRCSCRYRVEWECTKVSRFISARAVINGKTYVRYEYLRESWEENKTISRRLSALVVHCNEDRDCDFHCEAATPPHGEWGMQCRNHPPHRVQGTF